MDRSEYINKVLNGDCLTVLPTLPEKCAHCVITSPPYFGLRSYSGIKPTSWPEMEYKILGFTVKVPAMECELGHERDPKEFIGHLLQIFREVRRVLRDDGTAWVNMGDSYQGSWANYAGGNRGAGKQRLIKAGSEAQNPAWEGMTEYRPASSYKHEYLKPKDMIMVPAMMAMALREDGWYLRSDIIWYKPNPMPESVQDRPTKAHEYIFLLSKSEKYYYDAEAIKTEPKYPGVIKYAWGRAIDGSLDDNRKGTGEQRRKEVAKKQWEFNSGKPRPGVDNRGGNQGTKSTNGHVSKQEMMAMGANKRTVWEIPTHSFPEAHFATFPEDLVVDPIKAGTSEKGCCSACGTPYRRVFDKELVPGPKAAKTLVVDERDQKADNQSQGSNRQKDGHMPGWINQTITTGWEAQCDCKAGIVPCVVLEPFSGAGTTSIVAAKLNRDFIAIELSKEYIGISDKRMQQEFGMFNPLTNGKEETSSK